MASNQEVKNCVKRVDFTSKNFKMRVSFGPSYITSTPVAVSRRFCRPEGDRGDEVETPTLKRPQTRQFSLKNREEVQKTELQGSGLSFESVVKSETSIITRSRSSFWKCAGLSEDSGIGSDVSEWSLSDASLSSIGRTQENVKSRDIPKRRKLHPNRVPCSPVFSKYVAGQFEGIKKVDFVKLLCERGLSHCLKSIWSHLSIEDIGRAQRVSAVWRVCILSDKTSSSRWQSAKSSYLENLNFNLPNNQHPQALSKLSPRKALECVTNRLASPCFKLKPTRTKTPSPGKFRHRLFVEEASRLRPDEQLQKCPRCTMPCRINPTQSFGTCTMLGCMFSFCTLCLCSLHSNLPCRVSVGPVKSKTVVSSKKSKNRLRRL